MTQRWLMALLLSTAVLALLPGCKKKTPPKPPPPDVQVITAVVTNVPIYQEWIGTIDGFVNAQIRAQVTGYLLTQNYAEGSEVKRGDLLFQIDPRPFQAALDQAKAKLAQDKAQQGKTALDVKRYTPLVKEQAISQEELDNAVQADLAAVAQVKADDALVETAQLNLSFTRVTSPVDGLAGIAQAQVGDLVSLSANPLTTVSQIDPVKVYFQVNEHSYLTFWKNSVSKSDSNPNVPLELILSDNSIYPVKGRFYFVNRQIDTNTGTLQVVGLFSNADFILRPGQYAQVRAQTEIRSNVVVLPQRAVTELQSIEQVAIVDATNGVHIKNVKTGERIGNDWIIEEGVNAGDHVIVEGTQKAKDGGVVNPKPYTPGTNNVPAGSNTNAPNTGSSNTVSDTNNSGK